jgi:hypothetical protein
MPRLRLCVPTKPVELMAIAVDASCTHLYTPGIRRHIRAACAHGATIEEIMELLKLCGALGVDACELGTPILAQELTDHQTRSATRRTRRLIGRQRGATDLRSDEI